MTTTSSPFPAGFAWGAATSAYQIEGAVEADGRGPSIWDVFCHTPNAIADGATADVACDHYRRYAEDVVLMRAIGLNAYRFSVAWPRVLPLGVGRVEPRGLDFYDRLVDALLEAGVTPWLTLYHWDLPQALEEYGGWLNRDSAGWFADYAGVVASRLGDRVHHWMTLNEPWVCAIHGYKSGWHAPGHVTGDTWAPMLRAIHHMLLAHGAAVPAIRAAAPLAQVGIALNPGQIEAVDDAPDNLAAARRLDGALTRWFLDPLYYGRYPADMLELYGPMAPAVRPGDMATIRAPLDFLGVNYYTREVVANHPAENGLLRHRKLQSAEGAHDENHPPSFARLLLRLTSDYQPGAIYVTENGLGVEHEAPTAGRVDDQQRISYLRDHIISMSAAIQGGAPVRGYFVWSLLDNFEWAVGYRPRLGLIHVDYATQRRTLKASASWYCNLIRANGAL